VTDSIIRAFEADQGAPNDPARIKTQRFDSDREVNAGRGNGADTEDGSHEVASPPEDFNAAFSRFFGWDATVYNKNTDFLLFPPASRGPLRSYSAIQAIHSFYTAQAWNTGF